MYSFSCEYKTGIEILEMKPRRTKDGKYKYQNISAQDLKDRCKKNGIKVSLLVYMMNYKNKDFKIIMN